MSNTYFLSLFLPFNCMAIRLLCTDNRRVYKGHASARFKHWIYRSCLALFLTLPMSMNAASQTPPSAQLEKLYDTLASAQTELDGRLAEDAVWQYWFSQAPTVEARALLDLAIERREAYDFEAAENHLNELVDMAPEYAEAYNQRAFIRFLRENLENAETDLQKATELEPNHFGAHAGLYLVYSRQGRTEKAFGRLALAVDIHPWLRERSALPEVLWPDRYREIHTDKGI